MDPSADVSARSPLVFYDGACDFCTAQAKRLHRFARGRIRLRSFHEQGALDNCPGLTPDDCMKEIKMIAPDGRIFGGAEAVVRAIVCSRPLLGRVLYAYYVPGLRALADRVYAGFASRRYALGRGAVGECRTRSCPRHGLDQGQSGSRES